MSFFRKKPLYPSMPVQEIQKLIVSKMAEALKPHGFKRDGATFCRQRGELVHIINLQGDKWNEGDAGSYYVNLSVFYGPASEIYWGNPATDHPKEYDGQLRSHLENHGKGIPDTWKFSRKVDCVALADQLVTALVESGLPFFEGIDTPLDVADYLAGKKKRGMRVITDHINIAIILSILGKKAEAQEQFDTYFRKNNHLKDNHPITKMVKRDFLNIARHAGLKLSFPDLDGEACVAFYVSMKGKQPINDERRTLSKLELFLSNLEKKNLGYSNYYGSLRKPGTKRIAFYTRDPEYVANYIRDRQEKLANPLQAIEIGAKD